MSFCFLSLHARRSSSSLDRTTSSALTAPHRTWPARRLSTWSWWIGTIAVAARGSFVGGPSILGALPLGFSVPRLPLHLSAAALRTLSPPSTPSSRTTRTIFPIPTRHRPVRSSRLRYLPACARAFFIYSGNSRTQHAGVTMSAPFLAAR